MKFLMTLRVNNRIVSNSVGTFKVKASLFLRSNMKQIQGLANKRRTLQVTIV